MLKHVRRGAALILSMAMFIQLGIGNNYITFASEETQTPEQTQEESQTTGEVSEESNEVSSDIQESTEPAPETEDEVTVPEKEAASTLIVQFVNEDKTNIDVNQYPDKEIALTGLYVNDPYQLVFNDYQINTHIEGYTLSKIVDAEDTQKEYPLTTIEQGYVDISLSKNITKIQLVYTKNTEPAQQPENNQTEADSQQPSGEQEESSEEDDKQINSQVMIAQLNSLSTIDVELVDTDGNLIDPKIVTINQGKISADSYGDIQGYQYDHAQTKKSGNYLDFVGELNGNYYYAMMSGDEGYYQPATPLGEDQIQLVYKAVGSPINLTKTGSGANIKGNEVDIPEYASIDSGFNIQVSTARGYKAIVKVNGQEIQSDNSVYTVTDDQAKPSKDTGKIEVEVRFNAVESYQYWVENMNLPNWHGASWENIGGEKNKKEFKAGNDFSFYLTISDEQDGLSKYYWRLDSFSINNEYVNVPISYEQGASAFTTMSSGTRVSIVLQKVESVGIFKSRKKYTYKISIENAYEDIIITQGNFRENSWKEVMVQSIEGVELQFYDNDKKEGSIQPNGWTLAQEARPEGFDSQGNGESIEFRYKVKPGYGNVVVNTESGTNTIPILESDGYYHFFVKEHKNEGLTILNIEATPINFSVKYSGGDQEAENLPADNNTYSISGAVNTESSIFVSNTIPTANGYVFNGWKIADSKSYWPGDSIDLVDVAEKANEKNELVFIAQWVPEDQAPERIPYNVNVYIENEGNRELIDQETKTAENGQRITILNLPSDKEELEEELQGYILDREASILSIVVDKSGLSIDFVYKKAEYTIKTDVHNGKIDPSSTAKFGENKEITFSGNKGYKLDKILIDGEELKPIIVTDSYVFENVTQNHTIEVFYILDETQKFDYMIHYYIKDTETPVPGIEENPVTGEGYVGEEISIDHPTVKTGYKVCADQPTKLIVKNDDSASTIVYYEVDTAQKFKYTVNYLEEETDKVLSAPVTGEGYVGEEKTVEAIDIAGYTLVTKSPQTIKVTNDGKASITFYYKVDETQKFDYMIHYYIKDTETPVPGIEENPVTGEGYVGEEISIDHPTVKTGYKVCADQPTKLIVKNDDSASTIVYYEVDTAQKFKYTVNYLEEETDKVLSAPVTGEGYVGEEKTVEAIDIAGYTLVTKSPQTIKVTNDGKASITFYYKRDFVKYPVLVNPYEGTYDGKGHNVTVTSTIKGDKVEYSTDGENYSDSLSFVDVTNVEQKVYVRVTNGDQSTVVESYVLITPAPVTVKTGSAKKVYDGTALTNTKETTITGLVNGEKVTLTTTGTITNVGSESNTVTVDWGSVKETNYAVSYKLGTLTVTAQSIDPDDSSYLNVKVSKPENKVYDGKDHKWIPEVTLKDGTPLVEGKDYTVTYSTENFKDVQEITVTIKGTGNYDGTVTRTYKITRRPITVTTDSAIKVYDGSALTADGRVEGIVDGETYGFVITGTQTEVGTSENTYKMEWTGSAKEGNYKIAEDLGTLTIVPQSIDPEDPTEPEDPDQPVYAGITVDKPEDKVYDGKEHKWMPTVTLSDGTVLDPENYEVSYDTEDFVNVTGKITVTITGTGNYAGTITREYQITPRAVTITSADDSKVYDGTPLINGNVSVTEGSLVSEEDILFKATGSQTEVGSSANTIELTFANEQMKKNYDVTLLEGTLTVTEKSAEKPDDSDSNKDSEKTDGEDTAAATNVGIFASLATSALAGMGILAALKKRRKD